MYAFPNIQDVLHITIHVTIRFGMFTIGPSISGQETHSKRKFAEYESQDRERSFPIWMPQMYIRLHGKANQIGDPCVTIGSFAIGNMKLDRFFVDLVLTGQTWEQM